MLIDPKFDNGIQNTILKEKKLLEKSMKKFHKMAEDLVNGKNTKK